MLESDELLKNLYETGKSFSFDTIKEFITYLVDERELESYVKAIRFLPDHNHKAQASYYPNKNVINIYLNNIEYCFFKLYICSGDNLTEHQLNKKYNTFLVNVIYHELEHARQNKNTVEKTNKDSLDKIIEEGIILGAKTKKQLTLNDRVVQNFYYNYMLVEKNAESMALLNMIGNKEIFNNIEREDYLVLLNKFHKILLRGYKLKKDELISAAEFYYTIRRKLKEFNELEFNDYSLLTSLTWGLPIDIETFKSIKDANDYNALKLVLHKKIMY